MSDVKQQIKTGDSSTVVQAGTVVIHQGMSETEVKQFALQVFEDNMPRLEQAAKETAVARANELVGHLLERTTTDKNHEKFERLAMPRKQNDFINAQKAFAFSNGDSVLKETLTTLIDKSLSEPDEQSLASISASVAIQTVANLTKEQLLILATCYYMYEVVLTSCSTIESFIKITEQHFEKIGVFDLVGIKQSDFFHLEAMNCIVLNPLGGGTLWDFLLKKYPGAFSSGMTIEEVNIAFSEAGCDPVGLVPCLHDKDKQQAGFLYESQINQAISDKSFSSTQADVLKKLLKKNLMSADQVKELFVIHSEKIVDASSLWGTSVMNRARLTTVGKAIGHTVTVSRMHAKHLDLQFF